MTITPLPSAPKGAKLRRLGDRTRLQHDPPDRAAGDPRRRWLVGLAKRVLPLVALGLLALLALYPELGSNGDRNRISYRRATVTPEGGQLTDAHYQGVDDDGRPYTVTATKVRQVGPDRTDLDDPKADMMLSSPARG